MDRYDERLEALNALVAGKQHAAAALNDLLAQRRELERRVAQLECDRISEQSDVDRLEGRSLKAMLLDLVGKKDEQLEKERAELSAAILKHDHARRELDALQRQIDQRQAVLNDIGRAEAEYERLLSEKAAAIDRMGGLGAEEIDGLRRKMAGLEARKREIAEAKQAGMQALRTADAALDALGSAGTWSTLDIFADSLISDLAKYNSMDEAQEHLEQLETQLRQFRAELADVAMEINADLQAVSGMYKFVDMFLDDIFTSFSTRSRISNAEDSVEAVRERVSDALNALEKEFYSVESEWLDAQSELRNKIVNTRA